MTISSAGRGVPTLVVLGLLAAGCDLGGPTPAASPTPTVTETPTEEPTEEPRVRYVEVTAETCLNIRERPALDAPLLGCAPKGTVLRREDRSRRADGYRWLRVTGDWDGWAAAQFLRRTEAPPPESE